MADSFSIERRKLMRMLGAKVVLTPRAQKGFGMYQKAKELAEANGWFLARQFETPGQRRDPRGTTAREILADFKGERLDYFVTGYGTGGTVAGVGARAARERPETKIMLCEPANAQLVGSGKPQERGADGAPAASHPGLRAASDPGLDARLHPAGAAGGDRQAILTTSCIPIAGAEGMKWAAALAQKEGIFTGVSGGSTFAVAHAGRREGAGGIGDPRACCPTPASAISRRRCSKASPTDMDEEETRISKSTPGYQMPAA